MPSIAPESGAVADAPFAVADAPFAVADAPFADEARARSSCAPVCRPVRSRTAAARRAITASRSVAAAAATLHQEARSAMAKPTVTGMATSAVRATNARSRRPSIPLRETDVRATGRRGGRFTGWGRAASGVRMMTSGRTPAAETIRVDRAINGEALGAGAG